MRRVPVRVLLSPAKFGALRDPFEVVDRECSACCTGVRIVMPFPARYHGRALNSSLRAMPGAVPAAARRFSVAGRSPPFAVVDRAGDLHMLGCVPGIHIPLGRFQLQLERGRGQQRASIDLVQELGVPGARSLLVAAQCGGDHL